ncbi:hypothetical protein BCR32DRAFT_271264 [Anaeromyces robustus]|uniref:Uncharacterized protein n=1 Tax=Anaeromyces robustus TaxID=1754192 RepID=A0A1Y1WSG9_9FUNG|nr:hypothetical protein BCR32DRAFT_271264 [Anaeromyces robustus]|eukprot:ORX76477.1 hypothetical protein BCR32DRAFT_271264 [Anaeromyces robustus]
MFNKMGNNSLFMEYPDTKNKLYIPYSRRNTLPLVSSPESIYNINNNINNFNNSYLTKKIINNENNNKLNNTTFEITNSTNNNKNNNNNSSQCYKKNCSDNILKNINYNYYNNISQEDQLNKNFINKHPNIKVIHTKAIQTSSKKVIDNKVKIKSSINYNRPITTYSISNERSNNRNKSVNVNSNTMKTPASVITNLHLDSFNSINESMISPNYAVPIYYTSSVPLTATTNTTTTANMNNNNLSCNNTSSMLNSYYCNGDKQYLVNDNNAITYIVNSNSNHKENIINSTSNKTSSLINKITATTPSSYNNFCFNSSSEQSTIIHNTQIISSKAKYEDKYK